MTRVRLRPRHPEDELARLYAAPHDHTRWADHLLRVEVTTRVAQWMVDQHGCASAADLSCGDGAVLRDLTGVPRKIYGDLAPGYPLTGPIEETLGKISNVDLFICSETLEHLDDPDAVLERIGDVARILVLSTPIGETRDSPRDENPEHYWGWDTVDVWGMLESAGWEVLVTNEIRLPGWTYDYQIHACRRRP